MPSADKLREFVQWCLVSEKRSPQIDREDARRFTLQMLVALFAEDIDLLKGYCVPQPFA